MVIISDFSIIIYAHYREIATQMKNISTDIIAQELCAFIKSSIVDKYIIVVPNTPFQIIGIDSLAIIEIVLFLERRFNISLPEHELRPENFISASTLAHCATKYQG
jgi:acyl carrier protein